MHFRYEINLSDALSSVEWMNPVLKVGNNLSSLEQKKNRISALLSGYSVIGHPLTEGSKWHRMGSSGKRWDKKGGKQKTRLFYSLYVEGANKEGIQIWMQRKEE